MHASELPEMKEKFDALKNAIIDFEFVMKKFCMGLVILESRIEKLEEGNTEDDNRTIQ